MASGVALLASGTGSRLLHVLRDLQEDIKQTLMKGSRNPYRRRILTGEGFHIRSFFVMMLAMERSFPSMPGMLLAALAAAGLAALTATAFAGWLEHGPAILLSMTETGFSLCF